MADTWHTRSKVFQLTELDFLWLLHILSFPPGLQVVICTACQFILRNICCHVYLPHNLNILANVSYFLLGIPGLKASLLEEFGIRLLTYDLPGFGESDPHTKRNLKSSAMDILLLANAVGINDKFWVLGYSSGSIHAWAALRYIPDRLAGTNPTLTFSIQHLFGSV